MSEPQTLARLWSWPDRANAWVRFGHPVATRIWSRRRGLAAFAPGALFGYLDWEANDFGTIRWTFAVLRAEAPGAALSQVRGVMPGATILLLARGQAQVKCALAYIDSVEAHGIDPAAITADRWHALGNRLAIGEAPASFDPVAHQAALARCAIKP